jgi:hypothetical protein
MFLLSMSAMTHEQMATNHQYKKGYQCSVAANSEQWQKKNDQKRQSTADQHSERMFHDAGCRSYG